jgi:hypothetical protein
MQRSGQPEARENVSTLRAELARHRRGRTSTLRHGEVVGAVDGRAVADGVVGVTEGLDVGVAGSDCFVEGDCEGVAGALGDAEWRTGEDGELVALGVAEGSDVGVVRTPTMLPAGSFSCVGSGLGRTTRYAPSVSRNSPTNTSVEVRGRWRVGLMRCSSAGLCRGLCRC